jgi:hypothetical protein
MMGRRRPDRKDVRALLLAPLVPTTLLFLYDGVWRVATFGPLALLGALLLGIYVAIAMEIFALVLSFPLLFLLRKYLHSLVLCIGIGAFIAALPVSFLVMNAPLPDSASTNGIPTVIDGVRTRQWYVETATTIVTCFALGAIGGGAFWWLRRSNDGHNPGSNSD